MKLLMGLTLGALAVLVLRQILFVIFQAEPSEESFYTLVAISIVSAIVLWRGRNNK